MTASRAAGLRLAVSLLTVVPVRAGKVDREAAGHAMAVAPVVGLIVGGAAAVVLLVAELVGMAPLLAAALAVAATALATRGLHLDGLADVADGLGSGKPAEAALAIMKKSDIGPFGVATLVFTVLIQVAALAQAQGAGHGAFAALVAAVTGRTALPLACRKGVPAARAVGLGALVAGSVRLGTARASIALVFAAAALAGAATAGLRGVVVTLVAVAAGLGVAVAVLRHANRRFGGITGDVLGSLVELSTTCALVVLALL